VGYRAVFDSAPDAILLVDSQGVIRDMNPQASRLLGYPHHELVGSLVERVVPTGSRNAHRAERARYMSHPRSRPMGAGLELRALRKDGREVPVEISLSPCEGSDGDYVIAVVRDVRERRRLRRLSVGTLQAAEDERRRIARELHDDTAQRLSALLVRLQILRRTDDPGSRDQVLDQIHGELTEALEGVRRISRGLRPPALEDVGIEAAVRSHLRRSLEPSDLMLELRIHPVEHLLNAEGQLVVYRVVQEAVSNVIRHARAERVRVSVEQDGSHVMARIVDDGEGFDPEGSLIDGAGLGLLGMDERARLVGGELRIRSNPETGTEVELRVPVQGEANTEARTPNEVTAEEIDG